MDENEVRAKIDDLAAKVDAVYGSVEKMRKFFLWTLIITAALFILPLIGLVIAIPWYLAMVGSVMAM